MSRTIFACNGAKVPGSRRVLRLDYQNSPELRVRIGLPRFVTNVLHLPDRLLDLLEIAAYVYAADRSLSRGKIDAVEYASWAREMDFHVRVRDASFWASADVIEILASSLNWMTGDARHTFVFSGGHQTPPANLFDAARVSLAEPASPPAVVPFSGGLDSLAGALTILNETDHHLILVSHQSQPRTKKTQTVLVAALQRKFPGRVSHYPFECSLQGVRGQEETQRSRSFLYTAIAASIAMAYRCNTIHVFENGVTSLNFARRQDLMNARASRTTHPQTLGRLARFFSAVSEAEFVIESPFLWKTKTDVMELVASVASDLISSSVSCTATFRSPPQTTHCGDCFQCIDRRLAAFAAGLEELDHRGLYAVDVIEEPFNTSAGRTSAIDYLRQAMFLMKASETELEERHLKDIADLLDWVPGMSSDITVLENVHALLTRHGGHVHRGLHRMRDRADDIFDELAPGSLLHLVAAREHLRPEAERLADRVQAIVRPGIREMFRRERPKDESDLNAKISALLRTHYQELSSEHPVTRFACACVVPDHELSGKDVLIEAKFIRASTTPAKASEGISADLVKYPKRAFLIFVILDLDNRIDNDEQFVRDIEAVRPCRVIIIH